MGSLKKAGRPNLPATKVCTHCNTRKDSREDFYQYNKSPWSRAECKICTRVAMVTRKTLKKLQDKQKTKRRNK